MRVYPVLLAGGSGSRLWPLSTKTYPKQFIKIFSDKTLLQNTALRLASSEIVEFESPVTVTNSDFYQIVNEQLRDIGIYGGKILIEPDLKGTAAAILAATLAINQNDKDAIIMVSPTDHMIADVDAFHQSINTGVAYAARGKLVTFAVHPSQPHVGYGYLETEALVSDNINVSIVSNFVEKPDLQQATNLLLSGKYLWNSGIFLFSCEALISAFKRSAPELFDLVYDAYSNAHEYAGVCKLAVKPWSMIKEISIDYAIMENANNMVAVSLNAGWSDLGEWASVWSASEKDEFGNAASQKVVTIDCSNCLMQSEDDRPLVGIGLEDIIAIAMPDAVLVAKKHQVQDVKKAVELLNQKNIFEAKSYNSENNQSGYAKIIATGNNTTLRRIDLDLGKSFGCEISPDTLAYCFVIKGQATIIIQNETKHLLEGQSIHISDVERYELENSSQEALVFIEIAVKISEQN